MVVMENPALYRAFRIAVVHLWIRGTHDPAERDLALLVLLARYERAESARRQDKQLLLVRRAG